MPGRIATGSAPQTPIRQPASIVMPVASATSSSVCPGLARDARVLGHERDLGRVGGAARERARPRRPTTVPAGAATGPLARSRNGFSLRTVRTNHVAASAIAAARRPAHGQRARAGCGVANQ